MALRTRIVEGELWVKGPGEPWRPATPMEQTGSSAGPMEALGLGISRGAVGMGNMMVNALRGGGHPGLSALNAVMGQYQLPGSERVESAAANAAQFSPNAVTAGEMLPDLALLPIGMSGGALAGGRMAGRVVNQIRVRAGAVRGRLAAEAEPLAGQAAGNLDEFGLPVSTAGAAARAEPRTLKDRVLEEFTAAQPLTDQQKAAAAEIAAGRVKFQPLPGQVHGSRLMLSAVKSNPQWLAEFEPELVANYREGARLLKRATGVADGTPLSDDLLDVVEQTNGALFNQVRDMVTTPVRLSPETVEIAKPALSPWQRRAIHLTEGEGEAAIPRDLPAEEVFELRSRLNNLTRELGLKGEVTARDDVLRAIEEIDEAIADQLGPEGMAIWEQARNQWRVKVVLDNPNAINKAGQINVSTMANAAQKVFRKQYRGFGPRKGLPEATQQWLDWLKVANAFPDAVGNSGTAERLVSMEALTSPSKYLKGKIVGRTIRHIADQTQPYPEPPP